MADARGRAPNRGRRMSRSRRVAPYERSANLSIKGASGPTWVIVANLVRGTSPQDVRLTFETFGKVTDVRRYSMRELPNNAVAFEVGFENRGDAIGACRKYNGVLADGRVLQVVLQEEAKKAASAPAPESAPAPAPAAAPAPAQSAGASGASYANKDLPIDVRRRLAEAEARYLAEQEAIISGKRTPQSNAQPKTEKLAARLGPLPLAQRLAQEPAAQTSGKSSSAKRKRRQRQASSMQVDQ